MDSTTQETANPETGTAIEWEQPSTIEVNGEMLTLDELKAGYLRTADYTRKTQELAAMKKELTTPKQVVEQTDEEAAADAYLQKWTKEKGYLTQGELDAKLSEQRHEQAFEKFLDSNPSMYQFKDALAALWKWSQDAWEDIAVKYGFSSSDKLSKAKQTRDVKGSMSKGDSEPIDISKATPEEYAAWKKANLWKTNKWEAAKSI